MSNSLFPYRMFLRAHIWHFWIPFNIHKFGIFTKRLETVFFTSWFFHKYFSRLHWSQVFVLIIEFQVLILWFWWRCLGFAFFTCAFGHKFKAFEGYFFRWFQRTWEIWTKKNDEGIRIEVFGKMSFFQWG